MTLAFSTQIKGKPTYFIEQINNCLERNGIVLTTIIDDFERRYTQRFGFNLKAIIDKKLHTIREDKANRWKAGTDIHFVINNRTKNRFQFAPVVKCVSVQKIIISYNEKITDKYFHDPTVFIDEKALNIFEMEELATNDGFKSLPDFLNYFNKDFTGKIIHWTNLKY